MPLHFLEILIPPEPAATEVGELTQALLLVNSSVAGVERFNNNNDAVKYNDSLCEVGFSSPFSLNQLKCLQINCDPWTEGVYQGTYTLKEVMTAEHISIFCL